MEYGSITLKEFIEARLKAIEDVNQKTFEMNNIAIKKAEDSVNLRLESMNEFRAQMKDQQSMYLTFAEYKSHVDSQQKQFEMLKEQLNEIATIQKIVATKASQPMVYLVAAATVVGLILSIISLIQKWIG